MIDFFFRAKNVGESTSILFRSEKKVVRLQPECGVFNSNLRKLSLVHRSEIKHCLSHFQNRARLSGLVRMSRHLKPLFRTLSTKIDKSLFTSDASPTKQWEGGRTEGRTSHDVR